MPVTVIIGGQYGSEGKGKVSYYLAQKMQATTVVRVGGTNSGHTIVNEKGESIILKQLPVTSINHHIWNILPAGSYINIKLLLKEIEMTKVSTNRLLIDPNAMIISDEDIQSEKNGSLGYTIGSTNSGTGEAVRRRISRSSVQLAGDTPVLYDYIRETVPYMRKQLDVGNRIIIEGTQGFGLSLLHSSYYPFVTSRDTSAAGFVSEAGLSPLDVDDIVMVLRTFPIRVGGYSGPLPFELNWDIVSNELGKEVIEYTSVTKKVRRVGYFHPEVIRKTILTNRPTTIVLNHVDYISKKVSEKTFEFINEIENLLSIKINYFGLDNKTIIPRNIFQELYGEFGILGEKMNVY